MVGHEEFVRRSPRLDRHGLEKGTLLRHTLKRLQDGNQLTLNAMITEAGSFAAADDDAR